MKRREDGAVREVMKELLRSDLRFHKTDCGRFGAMTAWGLKDTSSRPPKDLGGTLRRASGTALRSWERLRQQRPRNIPSYRGRVANTVGKSTVTSQQFCPAAPERAFAMLLQNRRSSGAAGLFISAATKFPMEVW